MKKLPVGSWSTPEAIATKSNTGINPYLVMSIHVGNYKNTGIEEVDKINDTNFVRCLVEDMEFSVEGQYSTPFQQSDPQQQLPTILAMMQSGTLVDIAGTLGIGAEEVQVESPELEEGVVDKALNHVKGLMHKTSFSKINSTQIYGSSTSIRLSGTILLVAWDDAAQVEKALQLLQSWASPSHLSEDSSMVSSMQGIQEGYEQYGALGATVGALDGLFHSVMPPIVSIFYGGKSYNEFYIESVSAPLSAPMNAKGERIAVKVQISFISRKAWDRSDITNLYSKAG